MMSWWSGLPRGAVWAVVGGFHQQLQRLSLNLATGQWGRPRPLAPLDQASCLIGHPRLPRIYAAEFNTSRLITFENYRKVHTLSLPGRGPCHLCFDGDASHLWIANYVDGSVLACPVDESGQVQPARCWPGLPHSRAHCVAFRAHDHRAWVADTGADRIFALDTLDEEGTWQLSVASPRQILFGNSRIYVVEEQGCHLTTLEGDGRLVSRLPLTREPLEPGWTGAGLVAHPRLPLLYATLRGRDSIGIFSLEGPELVACFPSGGKSPRDLGFTGDARWLWVVNQESNRINLFRVLQDGSLEATSSAQIQGATTLVL